MRRMMLVLFLMTACLGTLSAQQPPMSPVQKEHQWLTRFEGEWETDAQIVAEGAEAMKCSGKMQARMLGGLWLISESETKMMGAAVKAVQTIGYDPEKKKYIGTWVDSMMNHMWQYEGSVDETGNILTLEADGPDFENPQKTARYRDVFEFKSEDHIVSSSAVQMPDGNWVTFVTGNARRKK